MTASKKTNEPAFEAALERLEEIVGDMEDGALSLDEMIRRFEEGQKLVSLCTRKLDAVDRTVEKLVKQGGKLDTEPLEPVDDADEDDRDTADEDDAADAVSGGQDELF